MPSTFAWLDFAESDRQKAMEVIDLFREQGTVDELGFAPIRDALADGLFPGTSTIQTRARYFLFVPWIMRSCESARGPLADVAKTVRKRETRLINALLEGAGDDDGIIGREAKGTLRRMPSSVYWGGLQRWGIRVFAGSIEQYVRRLAKERLGSFQPVFTDDREPVENGSRSWHPSLPPAPEELLTKTEFELTFEEAEFLADRIQASCPGSLLEHLVTRSASTSEVDYVWEHPLRSELPRDIGSLVEHARCFSLCAWGGPLLYARMVGAMKNNDEVVGRATDHLLKWRQVLEADRLVLSRWNRAEFWSLLQKLNPRISHRTRDFAERWIEIAMAPGSEPPVWDNAEVRKLIVQREGQLKGGRARLRPENTRARDCWQGDGSGRPMDFRWRQTQIILNDIIRGLRGLTFETETAHA
ncbi:MAG TPA: DUF6361 family protein [Phycisphaerae bacterium]|nr:DUF6361 family protein [Phycisphaerae bacterium]